MAIVNSRGLDVDESIEWSEGLVSRVLAKHRRWGYRSNLALVPNVSWGFLGHEADILCCSKAKYLTEIEIKVTLLDWKADKSKRKWSGDPNKPFAREARIKNFWYAAPYQLAVRWEEVGIPEFAGVLGVSKARKWTQGYVDVIKKAKDIPTHRKLRDDEVIKLLRLGALRYWDCSNTLETSARYYADLKNEYDNLVKAKGDVLENKALVK
jgi:hypothetical protein